MEKESNNGPTLGGQQACASCKKQRKKCAEDCVMAPLFPAHKMKEFNEVHKLFGVSNVSKLLKSLPSVEDRKQAAASLIWEAACRVKDPVLGPLGEYKRVLEELNFYENQNLMHQFGGRVLKSCPNEGTIGWSDPNNNNGPIWGYSLNNSRNFMDIVGNECLFEPNRVYSYPNNMIEKMFDSDNDSNQQYYLPEIQEAEEEPTSRRANNMKQETF